MAQTKKITFVLLLFGFIGAPALADTYGPVTLTVPPGWQCQNDNTNYVCLDKGSDQQNTSAIVVSFKNKSPEDSLVFYKNQLSQPRQLKDGEVVTPSEVRLVHELDLGGTKWIEGVHLNSELKGYFTHYFITVVDPYAVLITVNIHESAYPADMAKLKSTIDSFRVTPPAATVPTGADASAAAPEPAVDPVVEAGRPVHVRPTFHIFGFNIPRMLVYLGGALLAVIVLLGYALGKE